MKSIDGKEVEGFKQHYKEITHFGKHLLCQYVGRDPITGKEFKSGQRHYTIANCMKKDAYQEYMRSLTEALTKQNKLEVIGTTFDEKYLEQSYKDFATLSVKTYQRGLSKIFFDEKVNENGHFLVKGPVGKGLGITN